MCDGDRIVAVVPKVRRRQRRITGAGLRRVADDRHAQVVRSELRVVGIDEDTDAPQPPDVLGGDLDGHASVHQSGYRAEPGQGEEVEEYVGGRRYVDRDGVAPPDPAPGKPLRPRPDPLRQGAKGEW